MTPPIDLLTIQDVAHRLGLCRQRIEQFCLEGRFGRKFAGRWMITPEEVEQFAQLARPKGAGGQKRNRKDKDPAEIRYMRPPPPEKPRTPTALRICQTVMEGFKNGRWCPATVLVGKLRGEIPPEIATRCYLYSGQGTRKERRQHPEDVRVDQGCQHVVFRCLRRAVRDGLLIYRGPPGGRCEYRLSEAGKALVAGKR